MFYFKRSPKIPVDYTSRTKTYYLILTIYSYWFEYKFVFNFSTYYKIFIQNIESLKSKILLNTISS